MNVSFILSDDELFSLLSLFEEPSECGKLFMTQALISAESCDLSILTDKKLAKLINDQLEIEPVVRMVIDAIACADNAENHNDIWHIRSPWISLICEKDPYHEGQWKITPCEELGIRN